MPCSGEEIQACWADPRISPLTLYQMGVSGCLSYSTLSSSGNTKFDSNEQIMKQVCLHIILLFCNFRFYYDFSQKRQFQIKVQIFDTEIISDQNTFIYQSNKILKLFMQSQHLKHYDHIICGGGLVGALWALFLRKRSHSIAVFESYWDLRQQVIAEGRSINLILSKRGVEALQKVGIKYQILEHATIIKGRAIHTMEGQTIYMPYGTFQHEVSYCISRNKLNEVLLTIAENNNVDLYFRHAFEDADFNKNIYTFVNDQETVQFSANYIYGADGANSKVRDVINRETGGSEQTNWFQAEYKQLFLPADQNGKYLLDPQSVHVWPRGDYFMMGQPNLNGTFSLTLVLPSEGPVTFEGTKDEEEIQKFLKQSFGDIYDIIPNPIYQFIQNPVGYFGTLFTKPWAYLNKAVLLGDSAHTIVPFLWQAVNVGFNDCVTLDAIIQKHGMAHAFQLYQKEQKPNGDAIANLSIKSYQKLAHPKFILQKQIQIKISQLFPYHFCSRYRAVFYGDYSYLEACAISQKNQQILQELCKGLKNPNQLDIAKAEKLLTSKAIYNFKHGQSYNKQ